MKIGRMYPLIVFFGFLFFSRRGRRLRRPEKTLNKRTAEDACPYKGSAKTPLFAFFGFFSSP